MQPEHQSDNHAGSHGHWAGQRSREVAPSQPETVDSSRTPDLVWPLTSEDTAFPSPSCPHSLGPSWIPGVALSVGGPGECATKKGHRRLLSLPKSVSVPGRRAGVGVQQEALLSHTGQGQCHPPSFPKAVRFEEAPHLLRTQSQGLDLAPYGRKVRTMEGVLCSRKHYLSQSRRMGTLLTKV